MTDRPPPALPTEISRTTLGAVIAAIGATFLLIASMSHTWWSATAPTDMGQSRFGVGLAGLQRCTEVPADIFAAKQRKDDVCVRLPFGDTHSRMKIPGSWAFFGRTTYYLTLLSVGLVILSLGVLIGGNRLLARVTPARAAVVTSALALISSIVFVILKPRLSDAFEVPHVTLSASFGMFMHIFGAIAAGAGAALVALDAPEVEQPAIAYRTGPAAAEPPPQAPPPRAGSEPAIINDTLQSPPPAEALEHQPAAPAQPAAPPPTAAQPNPPPAAAPQPAPTQQPPVAFYEKPAPPPTPRCKQCGGPTRYIETFHKAFCDRCEVYTRMG